MARRWNVFALFVAAFNIGRGTGGDVMVGVGLLILAIAIAEPAWWFSLPNRPGRSEDTP